jgi:BCD family chlorophyll transporter-like MFS transporter
MRAWAGLGTRFLPFADAATPELPLSRLLRLSLFQVAVGMALVMVLGTLNRVMIVELGVPASLVGIMISLPVAFAPFRALIGFRSDTHRCELGWKRVPFMYRGTMLQFGGLAIMPFALLVLSGQGDAAHVPAWVGLASAGLAFLLVGAGVHTTQTVGLALAADLAPKEALPNVVGLMYVMLLLGMFASALIFGALLADFTHGRLVQVVQGTAVATVILNGIALWKQEPRRAAAAVAAEPSFREAWTEYTKIEGMRPLIVIGLGTMGFGMADVLLEPYGGQILQMSVAATTKLTAALAIGGLAGFTIASYVLRRGADPWRMAWYGVSLGIPAFAAVIAAAPIWSTVPFVAGTLLIGFGAGLFGHGTLTATMNAAPKSHTGLALGAWGAVQASAAGLAIALGGVMRDLIASLYGWSAAGAVIAYNTVFAVEIVLLAATCIVIIPLLRGAKSQAWMSYLGFGRRQHRDLTEMP